MYYIFDSKLQSFKGSNIQAEVIPNEVAPLFGTLWSEWRLEKTLRSINIESFFEFEARSNVPHPDNYWTGAGIELYSEQLLRHIEGINVRSQIFEAKIYDRKTKGLMLTNYKVFRLMETYPYIDLESSDIRDGNPPKITKLAVRAEVESTSPPLFIDENLRYLVFISEQMKQTLEDNKVTGCSFMTIEDYVSQCMLLQFA